MLLQHMIEAIGTTKARLINLQTTMEIMGSSPEFSIAEKSKLIEEVQFVTESLCVNLMARVIAPRIIIDPQGAAELLEVHMDAVCAQAFHICKELTKTRELDAAEAALAAVSGPKSELPS